MLVLLFSMIVNAKACESKFGARHPDTGNWTESIGTKQHDWMLPIELDSDCQFDRDSLEEVGGKFIQNASLKSAKRTMLRDLKEAKEKVIELEAKTDSLEDAK